LYRYVSNSPTVARDPSGAVPEVSGYSRGGAYDYAAPAPSQSFRSGVGWCAARPEPADRSGTWSFVEAFDCKIVGVTLEIELWDGKVFAWHPPGGGLSSVSAIRLAIDVFVAALQDAANVGDLAAILGVEVIGIEAAEKLLVARVSVYVDLRVTYVDWKCRWFDGSIQRTGTFRSRCHRKVLVGELDYRKSPAQSMDASIRLGSDVRRLAIVLENLFRYERDRWHLLRRQGLLEQAVFRY